jgi:hypothetical protein
MVTLKTIQDETVLIKEFKIWLNAYQSELAHYALGVYTPEETYFNKNPEIDFKVIYKEAGIERREQNKKAACKIKCS